MGWGEQKATHTLNHVLKSFEFVLAQLPVVFHRRNIQLVHCLGFGWHLFTYFGQQPFFFNSSPSSPLPITMTKLSPTSSSLHAHNWQNNLAEVSVFKQDSFNELILCYQFFIFFIFYCLESVVSHNINEIARREIGWTVPELFMTSHTDGRQRVNAGPHSDWCSMLSDPRTLRNSGQKFHMHQ